MKRLKFNWTQLHSYSRNREVAFTNRIPCSIFELLAFTAVPFLREVAFLETVQVKPLSLTIKVFTKNHVSVRGLTTITELILLWIVKEVLFFSQVCCSRKKSHLFFFSNLIYWFLNRNLLKFPCLNLFGADLF
jgi:hypothetical protein